MPYIAYDYYKKIIIKTFKYQERSKDQLGFHLGDSLVFNMLLRKWEISRHIFHVWSFCECSRPIWKYSRILVDEKSMPPRGIEPWTLRSSVLRSPSWATKAFDSPQPFPLLFYPTKNHNTSHPILSYRIHHNFIKGVPQRFCPWNGLNQG